MTQMQTHLDNESRNFTEATEENIKLKAALEQINTKCIGLESKVRIISSCLKNSLKKALDIQLS